MFNKRSLPDETLEDLPRVFENANLAGVANVDDLAVNRKHGNQARDLLRKAFRKRNETASGLYLRFPTILLS